MTNPKDRWKQARSLYPAIPAPILPPPGRELPQTRSQTPEKNHYRAYRRAKRDAQRQADAVYDLQMREAIMRYTLDGYTLQEIAEKLGQSASTIRRYRGLSMERAVRRAEEANEEDRNTRQLALPGNHQPFPPPPPPSGNNRGSGPGPHRPGGWKDAKGQQQRAIAGVILSAGSSKTGDPDPPPTSGEVLDPPDVLQARQDCLMLRKAAMTFSEIAEQLGITDQQARHYTHDALKHLETSELNTADLERRLMIEQLDQMLAAVHPMATGRTINKPGQRRVPVLEAIDRMSRLLKQKAELMGISEPPSSDIMIRLQQMADEGQYEFADIMDIARDVFAKHKIPMPAKLPNRQERVYSQPTEATVPPASSPTSTADAY